MEESNFFSNELTAQEKELYDRQFRLEGWNQAVLKKSRVLIAGVGGLGCEIAKNLAMIGVGHMDLVDMDIIEHSNLNRQILFVTGDVGEPKATVAADTLRKINPTITIAGHHSSLERLDPRLYKACDVIVGGLDSTTARNNLNAQAVRFGKPLVDGGVGGYNGHVYTIFPGENACYECYPVSAGENEEMNACTVVGIPRKRVHCVFKGNMLFQDTFHADPDARSIEHVDFILNEANRLASLHGFLPEFTPTEIVKILDRHDPGIITINAVISSIQSHETIKILNWNKGNRALGQPMNNYLIFNGMTMKFYHIEKKRNPNCMQCGDSVRRIEIEIQASEPCQRIIDKLLAMGFKQDPDMEPILTISDFHGVKIIENDESPTANGLQTMALLTAAGFTAGEIFITLKMI